MEQYAALEMEIIAFDREDVIVTSVTSVTTPTDTTSSNPTLPEIPIGG